MARLTDIPEELQSIIFSYLDKEDHLSLSKTHRVFKIEAQRQIFRKVFLPAQSPGVGPRTETNGPGEGRIDYYGPMNPFNHRRRPLGRDYSKMPPFKLPSDQKQMIHSQEFGFEAAFARERFIQQFLGAIKFNPTLATFVRYVRVHAIWGALNVFHTSALDMLNLLPNLRGLSVYVLDMIRGQLWKVVQTVCAEWLLQVIKKSGIKTIHVELSCLPIINKILRLKHLQEFEFTGPRHVLEPRGQGGPTEYGQWIDLIPVGNLKSVRLGNLELHPNSLTRLCTPTTALTHLSLCYGQFIRDVSAIATSLSGIRKTLQVLEVFEPPPYGLSCRTVGELVWQDAIFGKTSFTQFHSLRTLKISSALWFNVTCRLPTASVEVFSWEYEDRMRAYQLLPSSIESLEIQFNLYPGVFGMGKNHQHMFLKKATKEQMKGYDWIVEFVQNQHALPNLISLRLMENPSIQTDTPYEELLAAYQPPQSVQDTFLDANVTLQVHLLKMG